MSAAVLAEKLAGSVVAEGDLLWTPPADFAESAQITRYRIWLERERGLSFHDYEALWAWSVSDLNAFWQSIWDYFQIIADTPLEQPLRGEGMLGARWFEGTRTNYAEHLLRHEAVALPGEVALCHSSETRTAATTTWHELGAQVRALATRLRVMGIRPGDRVVSYMPNVPETAVAMIATAAIGAVWSAASPEFGAKTVIERFGQISPKLAFVTDGYSFNGRHFDRRDEIATIAASLPSLEGLVVLSYLGLDPAIQTDVPVIGFADLLAGPPVTRDAFKFERVASNAPLWILFSSGTTGLPKAIVHSHPGMIAEHLKVATLHCNAGPEKRVFFYSTTGWMMWNSVISVLITGASAVLYDGSPVHGGVDMIWRMAAAAKATLFGASPTLVQLMKKAGVVPRDLYDLSALDTIICGGAPATPETFAWFYECVDRTLWVTSQSGGTEICSGLAVGVPTNPVRAGEIQGRGLGIDVHVWNDEGREIIDQIGELVVTSPMPSAPLYFWGDEDGARYRDSYYATFAGVWRHGDLAKVTAGGGVYIYGRSDSTLNRFGVRIGTAEIYRILETIEGVADSLVVCCETPDGGFYMPMFVALAPGVALTDDLRDTLARRLRDDASPRHVPDEIHAVPAIPYTLTGKKMEVPIRKIVMGGRPETVISRDAMADPLVLDWFVSFASRPEINTRMRKHHHG